HRGSAEPSGLRGVGRGVLRPAAVALRTREEAPLHHPDALAVAGRVADLLSGEEVPDAVAVLGRDRVKEVVLDVEVDGLVAALDLLARALRLDDVGEGAPHERGVGLHAVIEHAEGGAVYAGAGEGPVEAAGAPLPDRVHEL